MTDESAKPDREEEAVLIARVQSGEPDAYEPLVLRYQNRIFSLVLRMVDNYEDARDLTQEAFVNAYRALRNFRSESSFHTWLFRIAVNTVISFRRRRRPLPQLSAMSDPEDNDGSRLLDPPDANPGPADAAETAERQRIVLDATQELDPEFRDAVVLRDLQGCSYEEMSEVLGCPIGTVKSRIHRGRMALKELLGPILCIGD